jgi:hypothetical protein
MNRRGKSIVRRSHLQRKRIESHPQADKDNMDSFNSLMVIGFFVASVLVISQFRQLDLSLLGLLKLYCLILGISYIIPVRFYRKRLTMSFYEYILFNLLGFTPLVLALFFLLNAGFRKAPYSETHKISSKVPQQNAVTYRLENDAYADKAYLRTINLTESMEVRGSEYLTITFSDGLFGIRIIEKKELH